MLIVVGESDLDCTNLISLTLNVDYQVRHAFDGPSALQMIDQYQPHLALLEVALPKKSGFAICRQVHRTMNLPVIFLGKDRPGSNECVMGLKLGGDDYIVKPFEPLELRARIEAVLRRSYPKIVPPPTTLCARDIVLDPLRCRVQLADGRAIDLPPVESRLLHYLMEHAGRVVSPSQILEKVWGGNSEINHNLVAHYIRCLRTKLERGAESYEYIVTVRSQGYKFQP
jgi:DNA-binding response OmpR family regulator